ncbi:cyclic nucleotide-binding domain-containing protein [Azonexus sp.]|uniref:cyclic nucleotide-binding domain-containing protein n=1 Tax=Azonexus sp. TaxID=1872668 RepID=UPI0027B8D33F|nr:cyclic nucleotide-binding domain-containing protein [Azonexus sp.]
MPTWTNEEISFHDDQRLMGKLIERIGVFNGLSQQELIELLRNAEKCNFSSGETIVRQNGTGAYLYIIIAGQVLVLKSSENRGGKILAKLHTGDCFGEMSFIDGDPRSASVIADSPCILLRLNENACLSAPLAGAKIFRNIARILSCRLRAMDEAYVTQSSSGAA